MMPQKKSSNGALFTIGGAIVGGAMGGPAGAAAGASLGGMAGGMIAPDKQGPGPVNSAVQRRIDTMQPAQNDAASLSAAQNALSSMPETYQKQYGPALQQAQARARTGVA